MIKQDNFALSSANQLVKRLAIGEFSLLAIIPTMHWAQIAYDTRIDFTLLTFEFLRCHTFLFYFFNWLI